jgi:hypothetical protein
MFGLSGGVGPFRLSVSNRGIGGSIGPLNAGTRWRSRSSGGSIETVAYILPVIVGAAVAFLVVAWPWYVGAWTATRLGAGSPSTGRTITAWSFEALWIMLLVAVAAATVGEFRNGGRDGAVQSNPEFAMQNSVLGGALRQIAQDMEAQPEGLDASSAVEEFGIEIPQNERLLGGVPGVDLTLASADDLTAYTVALDEGTVVVTNRAIRFVGAHRRETWTLDQALVTPHQDRVRVDFHVLRPVEELVPLLYALIEWGKAYPHVPPSAPQRLKAQAMAMGTATDIPRGHEQHGQDDTSPR